MVIIPARFMLFVMECVELAIKASLGWVFILIAILIMCTIMYFGHMLINYIKINYLEAYDERNRNDK